MKFKKLIAKSILTTVICLSIFTAPLISQTCVHNHPSLEQNTINEHAKSTNDDTDGKLSLSFANGHSSLSKANDVITIIAQLRGGLDPDAIT
jgi:hypothetical protein